MVDGHLPTWENASHVEKELPQLVSAAHKGGAKVLTSLGGWSGSITFRYTYTYFVFPY
jgi:chitinase